MSIGVNAGSNRSTQAGNVWNPQAPYLQALYAGGLNLASQQINPYFGGFGAPGGTYGGGIPTPSNPTTGIQSLPARTYNNRPGGYWAQQTGVTGRYTPTAAATTAQSPGTYQGGATYGVNPYAPYDSSGYGSAYTGTSSHQAPQASLPMASPFGQGIGQAAQGLSNGLFSWLGQGSPYLQGQINSLGQNLGNFYNQQILPGIASQAGLAGGTQGGSRQQIAQGLAGQGVLQQFQQGATNLQAADYGQNLANIGSLYNLGMSPFSAQWQPYQQLAQLIGNPTILGQGTSGGWQGGFDTRIL